ncbi:hypothetical protein QBX67_28135, partial [Bacillus sp. LS15-K4]|nr:hypothetical protein [Bacillus sp. LS15-K4]
SSMLLWALTQEIEDYQSTVSEDDKIRTSHPMQKSRARYQLRKCVGDHRLSCVSAHSNMLLTASKAPIHSILISGSDNTWLMSI